MLLIIPLGCTNDADGNLDAESPARVELVLRRYREAVDAGKACRVLPSGGTDPAFAFNPTPTPHWEYVSTALLAAGLPEDALIQPGMPALHTVDEAIMARQFLLDADGRYNELLVITSDFHASRVRHLFGVAIGAHARCEIAMRVEEHAGSLTGEALVQRQAHEKKGIKTLRTEPFGAWADFVKENGLEAANRSARWSKALAPVTYESAAAMGDGGGGAPSTAAANGSSSSSSGAAMQSNGASSSSNSNGVHSSERNGVLAPGLTPYTAEDAAYLQSHQTSKLLDARVKVVGVAARDKYNHPTVLQCYPLRVTGAETAADASYEGHRDIRGGSANKWKDDAPVPWPNMYWLVDPELSRHAGRLEHEGLVQSWQKEVNTNAAFAAELERAHREYAATRWALLTDEDRRYCELRPKFLEALREGGIGGLRFDTQIKCLHLQLAHSLAGGENPVGKRVLAALEEVALF